MVIFVRVPVFWLANFLLDLSFWFLNFLFLRRIIEGPGTVGKQVFGGNGFCLFDNICSL